jgi:hypothetical protein
MGLRGDAGADDHAGWAVTYRPRSARATLPPGIAFAAVVAVVSASAASMAMAVGLCTVAPSLVGTLSFASVRTYGAAAAGEIPETHIG